MISLVIISSRIYCRLSVLTPRSLPHLALTLPPSALQTNPAETVFFPAVCGQLERLRIATSYHSCLGVISNANCRFLCLTMMTSSQSSILIMCSLRGRWSGDKKHVKNSTLALLYWFATYRKVTKHWGNLVQWNGVIQAFVAAREYGSEARPFRLPKNRHSGGFLCRRNPPNPLSPCKYKLLFVSKYLLSHLSTSLNCLQIPRD
jgi:hypothetical protein